MAGCAGAVSGMDPFDKRKTDAVWQRVAAAPSEPEPLPEKMDLMLPLSTELQLTGALYLQLAGRMERQTMENFARQTRQAAACLRGLWQFAGHGAARPEAQGFPGMQGVREGLLLAISREQAHQKALVRLPMGGGITQMLANESLHRCKTLLMILGSRTPPSRL